MKILEFSVKGFRSLADVTWNPGDLNVLIGPNAGGKSNLLRILELLSVSARGRLGKLVQREGGMDLLVWDGAAESVEVSVKTLPLEPDRDVQRDSLTYQLHLARLGKTSAYRVEHELLGNFYRVRTGVSDQPFKLLERRRQRAVIFDEDQRSLVAPEETVAEQETLLSMAAGPFLQNQWIARYQRQLASWAVYQDLHTDRDAAIRKPAVATLARRVAPDGQNLVPVLHTLYTGDREFKREVDAAMRAAFGEEYEELVFPPAADQLIQLQARWKSLKREQSAANLSDGTLRFLFLLAVLATPDLPALIAIDEPEVGLHPSMFSIVAAYAAEAAQRSQVILATHSPSFLDAFRDTIPTVTVVESLDGRTELHVCSGAELEHWLDEYTLGQLHSSRQLERQE